MTSKHIALGVLGLTVAQWFQPATAEACSCASDIYASWPDDSATNVPTDTPVLLEGVFVALPFAPAGYSSMETVDGGTEPVDAGTEAAAPTQYVRLYAPAHNEWVNLLAQRELPKSGGCSSSVTVALPERSLRPDTDYEVRAPVLLEGFRTGEVIRSFKTGSEAGSQKVVPPDVLVAGDGKDPKLITTLFVREPAALPVLLHVVGITDPVTALIGPDRGVEDVVIALGGVECPEVEFVSLYGETVSKRKLCQADKCYTTDTQSHSSCGGNPGIDLTLAMFDALPEGCPEPGPASALDAGSPRDSGDAGPPVKPVHEARTDTGDPPKVEAKTDTPDDGKESGRKQGVEIDSASSSGCSLVGAAARTGGGPGAAWSGLLLALGLAFTCRRR